MKYFVFLLYHQFLSLNFFVVLSTKIESGLVLSKSNEFEGSTVTSPRSG